MLAYRKLEESEYSAWNSEYVKAKTTIGSDREDLLEHVADLMEKDLILVGATAVEDKLQEGVGFLFCLCTFIFGSRSHWLAYQDDAISH